MRHKNDIALAASSARSYNRHWRAKKLSWTAIGKIKYLFDGAVEYMDEVTLAYTSMHFNKLRKALGFKQDSELSELVEKAGAFRIVRNRETNQLEAFMSPLVGDRFTPTKNQVIEEPAIPYEIFDCKANALANDNDRDKISENQRQHKNGIDMHVLLAGNVPKFHVEANEEAVNRVVEIINHILDNKDLHQYYFGECVYHICKKYNVDYNKACEVLNYYVRGKLAGHMSRRVGIENWPLNAILDWLRYYFGAKRLSQVITEVREEWNKQYANKF
jgi:hypothetical protein